MRSAWPCSVGFLLFAIDEAIRMAEQRWRASTHAHGSFGDTGARQGSSFGRVDSERQEGGIRCSHLVKLSSAISFCSVAGTVVEVEAYESEEDTGGLDRGGSAAEPDNSDDDDENALDERGDRVGDRRDHGEEYECDDVLGEVEDAVEDELDGEAAVVECVVVVDEVDGAVTKEISKKGKAFGPDPEGECEEEGEPRAVAEEVEFVEFAELGLAREAVSFGLGGFVKEFFGEDVLGDEDDGTTEGAEDAEKIA